MILNNNSSDSCDGGLLCNGVAVHHGSAVAPQQRMSLTYGIFVVFFAHGEPFCYSANH